MAKKIEFSFNRSMSTKLPPIAKKTNVNDIVAEDAENDEFIVDEISETKNKKSKSMSKQSSAAFLDEFFVRAYNLVSRHTTSQQEDDSATNGIAIGIELDCKGLSNTRIAYSESLRVPEVTQNGEVHHRKISTIDIHIGNVCSIEFDNDDDRQFATKFQSVIEYAFKCFGKRFSELTADDKPTDQNLNFQIIDHDQFPFVEFDSDTFYSVEKILTKYFEYLLKSFDGYLNSTKKISDLCLLHPSHFSLTQTTLLRDILNNLSIKKCTLVDKSFGIAAPILLENKIDNSNCLIVEFNSGYMSVTVMTLEQQQDFVVKDRYVDKKLSQEDLKLKVLEALANELKKKGSAVTNNSQLRLELDNALKSYIKQQKNDNVSICVNNVTVQLDLGKFGIDSVTDSIMATLKKVIKTNEPIKRVVLCSSVLLSATLSTKLEQHYNKAKILVINDVNHAVFGSITLIRQLKRKTFSVHNIVPNSIGLCLYNGTIKRIVTAKEQYPCIAQTQEFQPINTNQNKVQVTIYEGESCLARNCRPIGEISIKDIQPANAKCGISLKIEENGVFKIDAFNPDKNLPFKCTVDYKIQLPVSVPNNNGKPQTVVVVPNVHYIDTEQDKKLFEALDSLDVFIEYVQTLVQDMTAQDENVEKIKLKVTKAKAYLSAYRFTVTAKECEKIRFELEECIGMKHNLNVKNSRLSVTSADVPLPILPNSIESKQIQKEANSKEKSKACIVS